MEGIQIEPITFGKGINLKRSPLFLDDGELVSCEGFSFDYEGVMQPRASRQVVNIANLNSIHSIHRYINWLLVGEAGNLQYKWDLDGYCNLYTPPNGNFTFVNTLASSNKWRTTDYGGFVFIATSNDMYAFCNGFLFSCSSIAAPAIPPNVTSTGGSGGPTDHTWYYTYVYRFKNGHTCETGLSPGFVLSAATTGPTATVNIYNSSMYPLSQTTTLGEGGVDTYTKLMLHLNGADASTTITDVSGNGHNGTCAGDAQLDTDEKEFGTASLLLDGTGDYVSISDHADWSFGTGDFTVDLWVRFASLTDSQCLVSQNVDGGNRWYILKQSAADGNKIDMYFAIGSVTKARYYMNHDWSVNTGQWYHISCVRKGADGYIFIDGQSQALTVTQAFSTNDVGALAANLEIGRLGTSYYLNGHIDELRISKGVARWTSNFTPPTAEYSATSQVAITSLAGVDVFFNVYKTSDDIGDIYRVYSGTDKLGTTVTDTLDDTTILNEDICSTQDYGAWPYGIKDVCTYLQRVFGIKDNKLYYSEPYLPFMVQSTSSIAVTNDGDDLTSVIPWGDQVYIASASTWYRLQGSSDSTWTVRNTFSEVGTINRHTVKRTRFGIVSLWYDGIYLFDGTTSKNITEGKMGTQFFADIDDFSDCYAEFNRKRYYFYYTDVTAKCLILDFSNYPDIVFYDDNFIPSAFEYHIPTGIKYFGKTDGYQYELGGDEVIPVELHSGDRAMKQVMKRKQLQYLYYDVDTNSKDLTLTVYVDGVSSYTKTINKSSRERDRMLLPKLEGYRFSIALAASDASGMDIYEPWALGYSYTGD